MNYMQSERDYNRGSTEYSITQILESGREVEIIFESDDGVTVSGVYEVDRWDKDILPELGDLELQEVEDWAITSYTNRCEEMENER